MAQRYVGDNTEKESLTTVHERQQYVVGPGEVEAGNRLDNPKVVREGFLQVHVGFLEHANSRLREYNVTLTQMLDRHLDEEAPVDDEPIATMGKPVGQLSCTTVEMETEARLLDMSLNRLKVLLERVAEL